jgi:hypothetical protein
MWLVAEYQAVTLFSLKSSAATSSGAKTLFLPTPFAIKMALLDAAIRTKGLVRGKEAFDWIRGLSLAICPPKSIVVSNLFTKIRKPARDKEGDEGKEKEPMAPTIAFREYAYLAEGMAIAFQKPTEMSASNLLHELLLQINYFGKKGSFFQLTSAPREIENLGKEFVLLNSKEPQDFSLDSIIQTLDDCGDKLSFDKANIYSSEKIKLGWDQDRVLRTVALPYKRTRSSKSFTYYEVIHDIPDDKLRVKGI